MMLEAGVPGAALVFVLPPPAQGDEDHGVSPGLRADLATRLVAVELRHPDVEQSHLGLKGRRDRHRLRPVLSGAHVVSQMPQEVGERRHRVLVVIGHQYPVATEGGWRQHVTVCRPLGASPGRRHRQPHDKLAALPQAVAARLDRAFMQLDHTLDQVQPDAEATLRAIDRYGVNTAFLVPTMFIRMQRLPDQVKDRYRMSTLRHVVHGAAPCPVHVKDAMIQWWGPVLQELYGGTEGIGTTSIDSREWLAHKGSVGRPSHGTELHILNDAGDECAVGVAGLIYLWNGRKVEYLHDPAKTAAARHPKGWMTLGDIGYRDADGYLYLTDRQSNLIISGGVNIYPQESENILLQHPGVADVAVIGVPHPEFGEEVKALVQPLGPVDDPEQFAASLMAWCRERLSPIKCPRSIDISLDALPRSDAGKLLKREIRKRYWGGETRLV